MAINVAQLTSFATVQIGKPSSSSPLYEGDTLEAVFVVAEGFTSGGDPVNPAPFLTDDGGWGAEIVMETGGTLTPTVDTPLADDGQIIIRLALDESLDKIGEHSGNVRIFNPIGSRTQQRVAFHFTITISEWPV